MEGQEWESVGRASCGADLVGVLGRSHPEADNTFCENTLFCHGFKNDTLIFVFIACTVFLIHNSKTNVGGRT